MTRSEVTEQGAVIPFRKRSGVIAICLIRRRDTNRWGIPKGRIEGDDTAEQTGLKEAHEEAGIEGRIVGGSIGAYRYSKWGRAFRVRVFLMDVTVEMDAWDEDLLRERRWVSPADASKLLVSHPGHELLETAFSTLKKRSS